MLRSRLEAVGTSRLATRSFRALIGTLVGNAVGFLLPFAVTSHFGFGRLTDAYFFALGFAIFGTVLSATVIEANALPLISAGKRYGAAGVRLAARHVARQSVIGVLVTYIPVAVVGSFIVDGRTAWDHELRHAAITLIVILTLLVVIVGATSVLAAVLYTFGDFFWPTATQSFRSIAPICGLLVIGHGAHGLELLAWLMVGGEVLRGCLLGVKVRGRLRQLPAGVAPDQRVPSIWRAAGPHAIAMVGVNLMPVVDRVVATRLRTPGSVTLLDLGDKVLYVPLLAVTYSVILVAGARWAELGLSVPARVREDFIQLVRRVSLLSVALAGMCILAVVALHALVPGKISGVPSGKLAAVVACFMVGLPAGAVTNVGSRLFTSLGRTRYLPPIAILLLIVDIGLDLVGAKLWGANGIALATTAVRLTSAPIYVVASLRVLSSMISTNPGDAHPLGLSAEPCPPAAAVPTELG